MATGDTAQREGFRGSPVVGYVRSAVPGDPRLDEWEANLRQYAVEHGYNLVDVVRDDGVSAVAVWKPGLERVLRGVETGEYVGAIVAEASHIGYAAGMRRRTVQTIERAGAWIEVLREDISHSHDK